MYSTDTPIKIAIVGPECTGKSTLSVSLALHYKTAWVPEYARRYINELNRPYEQKDLINIAQGQLSEEKRMLQQAKKYLFCDTNLLVIKIWSNYKYGAVDKRILHNWHPTDYAFHLLTYIDLPWEHDPLREHPEKREVLFDLYKHELNSNNIPHVIIRGENEERIAAAIDAIESLRL